MLEDYTLIQLSKEEWLWLKLAPRKKQSLLSSGAHLLLRMYLKTKNGGIMSPCPAAKNHEKMLPT